MKCRNCSSPLDDGWKFCPKCGAVRRRLSFGDMFSKMFKEIDRMTKNMDQEFEKDIEAVDISPFFRNPKIKKSGFTVRIHSGTGMEPKVEVKTFGGTDKEEVQQRVRRMGYKLPRKSPQIPARKFPTPRTTEEPATEVSRMNGEVVVNMELPGVKEKDIHITELEASVEVKAFAGEKAYFKILTIPKEFSLAEKKFHGGKLHLVFS